MKVVFDHQMFSVQKHGGITRYFCELAKRLDCFDGVEVSIIAPFYVNEYIRHTEMNTGGYHVAWNSPVACWMVRAINNMTVPRLIARSAPDIVHETYFSREGFVPVRSKSVLTVFDMIHEKFGKHLRPSDNTSELKRMAVQRSDRIICISENTRQDLIDAFKVDPDKVSVTHLASSLPQLPNTDRIVTEPYILYVGPRGEYKNFQGLLSAYASSTQLVSDFKLVCFGGRPFTKNEKLQLQEMKVPADRLTHLTGNDTLLVSLYMYAAVFVYPSLYEGFGMPPLEAMGCGCPVACSNTSSLPEVVGTAATTFDPYNVDDIRHSIEDIVYHPEKAENLIKAGKDRARMFSWDKCAQQTLAVYRQTLEG